jgi:hypothetical protein
VAGACRTSDSSKTLVHAASSREKSSGSRKYASEAVIWHSHDCLYQPRSENLAMLRRGGVTQQKVRYRDRRIRVFEGGFVQQHRIEVTWANGFEGQMDVCFVAYVRDGMLSRVYEYFDTGQVDKFLPPREEAS